MNPRLLGTLCLAGGLIALADGIRLVALGRQMPASGLQQLDSATDIATTIGALAGLCGVLGLLALRATGTNPVFRLLTCLPALSYIAAMIGSIGLLLGVLSSDSDNPGVQVLWITSDVVGPVAWLVVGILAVAAKQLSGWRRFVPFVLVLAFPLGIAATELTGLSGTFRIVFYAAIVVLGYAVQRVEGTARLRNAIA